MEFSEVVVKISKHLTTDIQISEQYNGRLFRIDHVTEKFWVDLDTNEENYSATFTGPSLTSTGKEHSVNRGSREYSTTWRGGRNPSEMPDFLLALTHGGKHLARMAGR